MKKQYNTLVLSGGGFKGYSQLGILHYYYEAGQLNNIQYVSGTSIGSIIGLLIIVGYTPMAIFKEFYKLDSLFNVNKKTDPRDIWMNMGLLDISVMMETIEKMVKRKYGYVPSLSQLYEHTHIEFFISTTNYTDQVNEKLCHTTHPNLSCIHALEMSCNIPGLFSRIEYENSAYVDGGLTDNLPYRYLSSFQNLEILVIVLWGKYQTTTHDNMYQYLLNVIHLPINQNTKNTLEDIKDRQHIDIIETYVDSSDIIEITLSTDRKMELFLTGYKEASNMSTQMYLIVRGWNDGWEIDDNFLNEWDEWK